MAATEPAPPPPDAPLLSIGELSAQTGVPASTLRYYDELGLVRPAARLAGRRKYAASAVRETGLVVFFRDIGFSLAEVKDFIAGGQRSRNGLVERKLAELAEQQSRIDAARRALTHGQGCPAGDQRGCPRFWSIIEGRRRGFSVDESHDQAH